MRWLLAALLLTGCVTGHTPSGKLRHQINELREILAVQNAELATLKERLVMVEEELALLTASPLECSCYAGEVEFD